MATKKKVSDGLTQSERFKQMARELGSDESPDAFDRTLKRIAPGKPAPIPVPTKRTKKPARAK
jgi:hypothetical protein